MLAPAIIFLLSCSPKKHATDEFYNDRLKWTMKIPSIVAPEDMEKWKKVQDAGMEAMGNTYDVKLKKKTETLFIFKSGNENFMEATVEPYDKNKHPDYAHYINMNYGFFYHAIEVQLPGTIIDTSQSTDVIDEVIFYRIKFKLTGTDNTVKNIIFFSRLFGDQDLFVSIMYQDTAKGAVMLDAFRKSKFDK